MPEFDDRLLELAADARWPPTPDLAERVRAAIEISPRRLGRRRPVLDASPRRRRRRLRRRPVLDASPRRRRRRLRRRPLLAAALALVVGGGLAATPGVGSNLLERLGLKHASITKVENLPPSRSGVALSLGVHYAFADAQRLVGFRLLRPAVLGEPDEVYVDRGVVTLLYRSGAGGPVLLTHLPPSAGRFLQKFVHADPPAIRVDGLPGYFLTGPHALAFQEPGDQEPRIDRTRLAKNTLLWERDAVLLRLEADRPLSELLRIARSVR